MTTWSSLAYTQTYIFILFYWKLCKWRMVLHRYPHSFEWWHSYWMDITYHSLSKWMVTRKTSEKSLTFKRWRYRPLEVRTIMVFSHQLLHRLHRARTMNAIKWAPMLRGNCNKFARLFLISFSTSFYLFSFLFFTLSLATGDVFPSPTFGFHVWALYRKHFALDYVYTYSECNSYQ